MRLAKSARRQVLILKAQTLAPKEGFRQPRHPLTTVLQIFSESLSPAAHSTIAMTVSALAFFLCPAPKSR